MSVLPDLKPSLAQRVFQSPGFATARGLVPQELAEARELIRAKWIARLQMLHPEVVTRAEAIPLELYHTLSDQIDHAALWTKEARLFTPSEVERLTSFSLFAQLREAFGPCGVEDVEGLGYPEIYWRLVRPGAAEDVAGAHADAWFYTDTNGLSTEAQRGLVKVWIPIHSEPGRSGLAVARDSHLRDWPHHAEVRHGRPKPVLDLPEGELGLEPVAVHPGEAVVFNIHLLHRGIAHAGDRCRVSLEFALRLHASSFLS